MKYIINHEAMLEMRNQHKLSYSKLRDVLKIHFGDIQQKKIKAISEEAALAFAQICNCNVCDFTNGTTDMKTAAAIRNKRGKYRKKTDLPLPKEKVIPKKEPIITKQVSRQIRGVNPNKECKHAYFNGKSVVIDEWLNDKLREINHRLSNIAKEFKMLTINRQEMVNEIGSVMLKNGLNKFVGPGWEVTVTEEGGLIIAKMEKLR